MPTDDLCPQCRERIPPDEADCPYCAHRKRLPLGHREPVLVAGIIVLAAGLWLITHGVTQAYGHREDHLARSWYASGDLALRERHLDTAISDLQTALVYSHDSPEVRLRLAEALAAAGHTRQAQSYLRALWDETPGDGKVNLELARLAARAGNVSDAQRYYHGAIYGIWNDDPVAHRRDARLEVITFLLARRQLPLAQGELIAVAADIPNDPKLMLEVARMFLAAGDPGRALNEFQSVLHSEPRNPAALAGAGQAAYLQQDYAAARRYLERAVALDPKDTHSAQLLQTSELVLQMDPYAARIGRDERARRVLRAFEQTQYRIEECAEDEKIDLNAQPPGGPIASDYAQVLAQKSSLKLADLARDPDLVDSSMDMVFRSQSDVTAACGQPVGPDLALQLIGRAHGRRP